MSGFSLGSEDYGLYVAVPFGEAEPKIIDNGGRIDRVQRPRNKDLTEWSGTEAVQIKLSFFFDAFSTGDPTDIERQVRVLERMNGKASGAGFKPPSLVVAATPVGVVPYDVNEWPDTRWWLESLDFDDGTLRDDLGRRNRCSGSVTLTEVVYDATLDTIAGSSRTTKSTKPKTYKVKKGDTLKKIAAAKNVKGGWKALAKYNNIRDPKKIKVGQVLRLP